MKPRILLQLVAMLLFGIVCKAQMKVGDNATSINNASILELETTNKGFVPPRVALTSLTATTPLPGGLLTGTIVFNTSTGVGSGIGLYYWNGTAWVAVGAGITSTAWSLTGNSGTNYLTNFIGTTDNVGFRVRTNNTERMLIDSLGRIGIGSSSFSQFNEKVLVDAGRTTSNTIANFTGSINDFLQINVQNKNSGKNASSDFVATADDGTDSTFYIDMGINSSNFAPSVENWGGPHDGYIYTNSRHLVIGTQVPSSDIYFLIGGGRIGNNTALKINGPNGNIVVGNGDGNSTSNIITGNTIRGPNASTTSTNLAGGGLTIAGGFSTGSANGGSLNIKGGASSGTGNGGAVNIDGGSSASGTGGILKLNENMPSATYINNGSSIGAVTIGGNANNIFLPKFSTVGGIFYISKTSGQLANTGSNMTWDSVNNRLGIGITPGYALSVLAATNPLYLSGVQATNTLTSDSILTINAGVVKKVAYPSFSNATTNSLSLSTNTLTSTVNGVAATSSAVSGVSNASSANSLNTTVNGITGTAVNIINSNAKTWTQAAGLTTTINGISSNITPASGTVSNILGYNAAGTPVYQSLSSLTLPAWNLTGNTGTTAGTNFLGTTDAVDLVFKTNNTERLRLTSGGVLRLAGTTSGYVGLQAAAAAGTTTYTLPAADGTSGQVLTTNGSGTLSWSTASGGGGGSGWSLTGNSSTNPLTNFLGTTDYQPLVFKANNTQVAFFGVPGGSDAIALGAGALATYRSVAIGPTAVSGGNNALAFGYGANAGVQDAIAIGTGAKAVNNSQNLAIGLNSEASSFNAIAIGSGAKATTSSTTLAVGVSATSTGNNSVAVGTNAQATATNSTAYGEGTKATAYNANAFGTESTASAQGALVIGNSSTASGQNATVIGDGLTVSQTNAFILGTSSVNVGIGTVTPNTNTRLDVAGSFKLGSVGTATANVVNLATGYTYINSISASGYVDLTYTLPSTLPSAQASVAVSPGPSGDLPAGVVIAWARVISTTQVKVRLMNATTSAITTGFNATFYITATQF